MLGPLSPSDSGYTMLRFVFGETVSTVAAVAGGVRVGIACPHVSGPREQVFPFGRGETAASGEWTVLRAPGLLVAAVAAPVCADSVETVTTRLYAELFEITARRHLCRVWHFVPGILDRPPGREETYRRFCRARADAFDTVFSGGAETRMPAASAVGVDGDRLVIVAVASDALPEHFENPLQTPAYRYPETYGPRPPSFARATRVDTPAGTRVFISGTAAVRGSDSLHAGDLAAQTATTRENLDLMRRIALAGDEPAFVAARTYLKPGLTGGTPTDAAETVVLSDICRGELLIESELSLFLSC